MTNDFVRDLGLAFLPHVLRRLSDELVRGAAEWHAENGLLAPPRTASTLLLLEQRGSMAVTEIAKELRQSHQLVLTWITQLRRLELVRLSADASDGRKTVVSLTEAGTGQLAMLRVAIEVEVLALQELMEEADAEVFELLWRLERACRERPYASRLRAHTKAPEERA